MCDCRIAAKKLLLESAEGNSKYLVVVGDRSTGKTSLIYCFVTDTFLSPNSPTMHRAPTKDLVIDGKNYTARLLETPWDSAYSQLRTVYYDEADVIIICFAVDNQESLVNVTKIWYPEIKKRRPSVKVILAATKCDLKSDENVRCPISYRNGQLIADEISAFRYVECSAKTTEGCLEVLKAAVEATL